MSEFAKINWFVLVFLTAWCWLDGFTTTAFLLTILVTVEAVWKPFVNSKTAAKLFDDEA